MLDYQYGFDLKPLARELRTKQTLAEKKLWFYLREKKILNIRFTRQKPIGIYIIDFYAKAAKLVIELDGRHHYDSIAQEKYDEKRDAYLKSIGLNVVRFSNHEVIFKMQMVLDVIKGTIQGREQCSRHSREYE